MTAELIRGGQTGIPTDADLNGLFLADTGYALGQLLFSSSYGRVISNLATENESASLTSWRCACFRLNEVGVDPAPPNCGTATAGAEHTFMDCTPFCGDSLVVNTVATDEQSDEAGLGSPSVTGILRSCRSGLATKAIEGGGPGIAVNELFFFNEGFGLTAIFTCGARVSCGCGAGIRGGIRVAPTDLFIGVLVLWASYVTPSLLTTKTASALIP